MPNLFCFGLGYTAQCYIVEWGSRFDRIAGTVREAEKAARIAHDGLGVKEIDAVAFDGARAPHEIAGKLAESDCLLVSVPPDAPGDPVLRCYAEALALSPRLEAIVYLSTIGVYGDHGGAWIDEAAEPAPISQRRCARLQAERGWAAPAA